MSNVVKVDEKNKRDFINLRLETCTVTSSTKTSGQTRYEGFFI